MIGTKHDISKSDMQYESFKQLSDCKNVKRIDDETISFNTIPYDISCSICDSFDKLSEDRGVCINPSSQVNNLIILHSDHFFCNNFCEDNKC